MVHLLVSSSPALCWPNGWGLLAVGPRPLLLSPLPRRNGAWISPQPTLGGFGCVLMPIQPAVIFGVSVKHPSHAAVDLMCGHILPLALHIGHPTFVAVNAVLGNLGLPLVAQLGQTLAGSITPRLLLLWRINGCDAHFHLLVLAGLAASGSKGVAVGYGDDEAKKSRAHSI